MMTIVSKRLKIRLNRAEGSHQNFTRSWLWRTTRRRRQRKSNNYFYFHKRFALKR